MATVKALLVMDMVNVYIFGSKPLIPVEARNQIINNIKKAIALAHKKNIPVIYINSAFRPSDPIMKLINYREQAMEGSKNAAPIKELEPLPKDYVLKKRGYDGFWKSGLENLLQKLKVNEIYLTGCQTDCCIRETTVTAAHLGYGVYVIEDCCQTSREFGQIAAIRFMKNCTRGIINVNQLAYFFSLVATGGLEPPTF